MMTSITDDEFDNMLRGFAGSAGHLETRDAYGSFSDQLS